MVVLDEVKVVEGAQGVTLSKYGVKLSPVSLLDYRAWLFGQPHSRNKDKLLELTLLAFPPEERTLTYYQVGSPEKGLSFTEPLPPLPHLLFSKQWYSYTHPGHYYVNFAHPTQFGGDFRGWENAQEEIQFCEFPKLAHVAYAANGHGIAATDLQGKPTPFLIPDVKRHTDLYNLYGEALDRCTLREVEEKIGYVDPHMAPTVHILGMAAIPWEGKQPRYTRMHLEHLLHTAYLAFMGAKMATPDAVVHTGAWGCGLFGNRVKTIVVIQLLAATLSHVEIVFDGVDGRPDYTEALLEEARKLISSKNSVRGVLESLVDR